ncbi:MAG: hypothetical protein R2822_28450 [Spirosomataceae bacterium]
MIPTSIVRSNCSCDYRWKFKGQPVVISGPSGSIASLAAQASAGDRLVVEVSDVKRRNFKGDVVDAGLSDETRTIPLN